MPSGATQHSRWTPWSVPRMLRVVAGKKPNPVLVPRPRVNRPARRRTRAKVAANPKEELATIPVLSMHRNGPQLHQARQHSLGRLGPRNQQARWRVPRGQRSQGGSELSPRFVLQSWLFPRRRDTPNRWAAFRTMTTMLRLLVSAILGKQQAEMARATTMLTA